MERTLKILKMLVEQDSSNQETANFLLDKVKDMVKGSLSIKEFEFKSVKSILASLNGNLMPEVLFLGHVDTVPALGWKTKPYQMAIKGNIAKGLGIYDMKAGIAIDTWKLKFFKRVLEREGYEFKKSKGITRGTMMLTVITDDTLKLQKFVVEANETAAASRQRKN